MEKSMKEFIKGIFAEHPDYNTLTKGQLRLQYMTANQLTHMEIETRRMFSEMVNQCLQEIETGTNESSSDGESLPVLSKEVSDVDKGDKDSDLDSEDSDKDSKSTNEVKSDSEEEENSDTVDEKEEEIIQPKEVEDEENSEEDVPKQSRFKRTLKISDEDSDLESDDTIREENETNEVSSDEFKSLKSAISNFDTLNKSKDKEVSSFGNKPIPKQSKRKFSTSSSDESVLMSANKRKKKKIMTIDSDTNDNQSSLSTKERKKLKEKVLGGKSNARVVLKKLSLLSSSGKPLPKLPANSTENTDSDDSTSTSSSNSTLDVSCETERNRENSDNSLQYSSSKENNEGSGKNIEKKPAKTKSNNSKEPKKKVSQGEGRIKRLKRLVNIAGIRVQSYNSLFENCKSMRAQSEKLLELLKKSGLKGNPSIVNCKKLRKKLDAQKEVSELDVSNILESKGRPKRKTWSLYQTSKTEVVEEEEEESEAVPHKRSKVIISSDEEDSN